MDFIMEGKQKKIKSHFRQKKIDQYWSREYQKMQNSNIWGDFWPEKLANIGPDYTERCRIGAFGGYVS